MELLDTIDLAGRTREVYSCSSLEAPELKSCSGAWHSTAGERQLREKAAGGHSPHLQPASRGHPSCPHGLGACV